MLEKKFILGVGITSATMGEVLEYIIKGLEKNKKKYFIVTPNPEILTLANNDFSYRNILNRAKIALSDGVGVIMAGKILGRSFKARVTGVDLLEKLCQRAAEKPITVGFLGAKDKIAEKAAECLQKKYPGLKSVFAGERWPGDEIQLNKRFKIYDLRFKKKREKFINHKSYIINHPAIDILFVAFGAPKQEIWISENLDKLPVRVAIGVGGAFDYISGKVVRAPLIIRRLGFEWLFRLIIEPWRIKRQLELLEFMWLVLKEKLASKSII